MSTLLLIFASALLFVVGATPATKWLAVRLGIMDQPSARKVHTTPMPRFGGIAMYGAVVIALIVFEDRFRVNQLVSILLGATWVSFLGGWDDRWGLRPILKFAGQIIAAIILIIAGVQVNFLDNMDGLSGGLTAIASAFFLLMAVQNGQFLVAGLSAALLGACVGFLVYNFNPASIFMGDTGALFLGFMLAALGIKLRFPANSNSITWMVPVLVLGIPIFDTTLVTISRIRRGVHP